MKKNSKDKLLPQTVSPQQPCSSKSTAISLQPQLPSFNGISSTRSFQQTNNQMTLTDRAINTSHTLASLDQTNSTFNDGVQYVFNFSEENVSSDQLLDIFQELTKIQHFQLIQKEDNHSTAIYQPKSQGIASKLNITQFFASCFPMFSQKPSQILGSTSKSPTAIKLIISSGSQPCKQEKICRIKGLSGSVAIIHCFIKKFKQLVLQHQPQQIRSSSSYFIYDSQKQTQKNSNQYSDPYLLEISTYYVVEKILNNDQVYQIGNITQNLIKDYKNMFNNIQQSITLVPEPVINATKIVNQIYYWFLNNQSQNNKQPTNKLNALKKQSNLQQNSTKQIKTKQNTIKLHQSMSSFMRISIQKYIFQKLYSPIFQIYRVKNIQTEQMFLQKRNRIFEKYTTKQILQQVSIQRKFWSVDEQKLGLLQQINVRSETRSMIGMCIRCCCQLQKIPLTPSPRQKIKHMQLSYTSLKTFFFDYSHHKYQLSSMEDIIPVLILIVLLVDVNEFRKELDIMGDFIQSDMCEMESQKRLFVNLSESYNYVVRDWKL